MKFREKIFFWGRVSVLALWVLGTGCAKRSAQESLTVKKESFQVWSAYEGVLDARRVEAIAPKVKGSATIEYLVPEGTKVKPGDVLVRFDTGDAERDAVRLERDYAAAVAELESLEKARQPLELRELESKFLDLQNQLETEGRYWSDLQLLLEEGLMSTQEVQQQETRLQALRKQKEFVEMQLDLTRRYLHPLALTKARATVEGLRQELEMARERLTNCVVTSPVEGLVAYRPVAVGGDYRNVRVGDTLFRNQTFMVIPNMTDVIVQINVPEAELSRVRVGCTAKVRPLSYPELVLDGVVESVGTMAQVVQNRPSWQKFFNVQISLRDVDDRLRPGMTVQVNVLSYATNSAITLPRRAVHWDGSQPWCWVLRRGRPHRQNLRLGWATAQAVEVLEGLEEGDRVSLK